MRLLRRWLVRSRRWLGGGGQSGGLNPLYQIGGPRSVQLALKLQFRAARSRNSTERTPQEHDFAFLLRYFWIMKRAFVLRLTPEAEPVAGKFEGRVEEVDSGKSRRFVTVEEFLEFLQKCLNENQPLAD